MTTTAGGSRRKGSKPARLRVAAVQMRFAPTTAENVAIIVAAIRDAAAAGADVVLFPECATTGYNRDFGAIPTGELADALAEVRSAARAAGCNVLVGAAIREGRRLSNVLCVIDRRGREVFRYAKIHLTPRDRQWFKPGNRLAFFRVDGVPCTALICHERRFPELVRLPVMMGARVIFHPNAGLDALAVSKAKRGGRDGIVARAFENQVFYVFANSVGPQGDGRWSAGDTKIVAPDGRFLGLADHRGPAIVTGTLELEEAGRRYAREALEQPVFLRRHWRAMLSACRRQLRV